MKEAGPGVGGGCRGGDLSTEGRRGPSKLDQDRRGR
jgi:hypothetical protein